jgi:hypothetical protein
MPDCDECRAKIELLEAEVARLRKRSEHFENEMLRCMGEEMETFRELQELRKRLS